MVQRIPNFKMRNEKVSSLCEFTIYKKYYLIYFYFLTMNDMIPKERNKN